MPVSLCVRKKVALLPMVAITQMQETIYLDSKKYLANFAPLKKDNSLFISRLMYSVDEQGIDIFLT
jgi:hypothetical protein